MASPFSTLAPAAFSSWHGLAAFQRTEEELSVRRMRLATGRRLLRAEDDSAAYLMSRRMQSYNRGQAQALANAGAASDLLRVAETSLNGVLELLTLMKEKTIGALNDARSAPPAPAPAAPAAPAPAAPAPAAPAPAAPASPPPGRFGGLGALLGGLIGALGNSNNPSAQQLAEQLSQTFENLLSPPAAPTLPAVPEAPAALLPETPRDVVKRDLEMLSSAIDTVLTETAINGNALFSNTGTRFRFQVTAEGPASFEVALAALDVEVLGVSADDLLVADNDLAGATLARIDSALELVRGELGNVGNTQQRLSFKQDHLSGTLQRHEAARSRIEDADLPREQLEALTLSFRRDRSLAVLAHAHANSQSVAALLHPASTPPPGLHAPSFALYA